VYVFQRVLGKKRFPNPSFLLGANPFFYNTFAVQVRKSFLLVQYKMTHYVELEKYTQ
jgi:hypothetical protein